MINLKSLGFYQAVEDVNNGIIKAGERLYQLKALQRDDRCIQVEGGGNSQTEDPANAIGTIKQNSRVS